MFLRRASRKRRSGAVPVYLNVYDLTTINGYAYWFGLGIYHSGVQVHGVEYAYGAHENPTSGIFQGEPRQCPGFQFRKSVLIGRTDLGPREIRALMDTMAEEYTGVTYHLISKNCNHFCDDASNRMTGNGIPRWVNRLAGIGFLCNCVLPVGLHVAQPSAREEKGREIVRRKEEMEEEKVKLRIKSPKYTVSHPSSASMTPVTPSSPIYNKTKKENENGNGSRGNDDEMTVHAAPPSISSSTSTSLSNGEPEATVLVTNKIKIWKMRSSSCSSLAVSPSFKSKISRFRFRRADQAKQSPPKNVQDDC